MEEYIWFPEIEIAPCISTNSVLPKVERFSQALESQRQIRHDNGAPFNGEELPSFMSGLGIHHTKITPFSPDANGEAEYSHGTLNMVIRASIAENLTGSPNFQLSLTFIQEISAGPTNMLLVQDVVVDKECVGR